MAASQSWTAGQWSVSYRSQSSSEDTIIASTVSPTASNRPTVSASGTTLARGGDELVRALDRRDPATELTGEDDGRAAFAGGDVEHLRLRPQPQTLAEEPDLLGARRILNLVIAFGNGVIPGHHPAPYDGRVLELDSQ